MGRTIAFLAAASVMSLMAGNVVPARATPPPIGLRVGDVLVYGLTIDVQIHTSPSPGSSQPPVTLDTAMQGTETMTGLRADPDGSVHARVDVTLHGKTSDQSKALQQSVLLKISPDGSVRAESGGQAAMQYFAFIDQATNGIGRRTLHVGEVFHRSIPGASGFSTAIDTTAKVVAQQQYHGYPTFAIQSTGSAKLDTQFAGAKAVGTLSVAGTTYYDQMDDLLIGMAARTDVDAVVAGAQGGRLDFVTNVDLVLNSRQHIVPTPAPSPPAATALPTEPPTESPSPAPAPSSGYYTPPPPSPVPPTPAPPASP
jgi:hypothetical protein